MKIVVSRIRMRKTHNLRIMMVKRMRKRRAWSRFQLA